MKVAVPVFAFARIPTLREELLAQYPDATFHEIASVLTEDELIGWLADRDAVIVGMEPITERVLDALPNLKIISKWGVGCETIDLDAVRKHAVRFGFQAGVNKLAVAELTLCFMLSALRWVTPLNQAMRAGERPRMRDGRDLTGRVVGIHGCGNVGKEVIRLLQAFRCEILVHDVVDYDAFYREYGVTPVSFAELLERSEVLSLHLPLLADTANLYDDAVLARLRPDCVLINTCRGGIVDEAALTRRLRDGSLVAACSDVFAVEPATNDDLLRLPNFLATPHIGASTAAARLAMGRAAIAGLRTNELVPPGAVYS